MGSTGLHQRLRDNELQAARWRVIVEPLLRLPQINPEALTRATHATPEDAVSIHKDVRSRASMAMHFATFAGCEDEVGLGIQILRIVTEE